MIVRSGLRGLVAALALVAPLSAAAGELGWSDYATGETEEQGAVSLSGSIGVVRLEAHEYVYAGSGASALTSHLIWQSTAPMLTGAIDVALPEGWTLSAKGKVALSGDSYMEDHDWFGPDFVSYDADDWTHRSQHDDTNLDWYFDGTLVAGYDTPVSEGLKVNVNGGLKFTDVQWTANGGTYIYSDMLVDNPGDHFRDYQGDFGDVKGITYRQTFPALIAGIDGEVTDGPWTIGGSAHAGVTFFGTGDDHHWLRDLNFIDSFEPAPLVSLGASVGYDVAEGMNVFVEGTAEQVFTARGDTDEYDIPTGDHTASYPDAAGGDLFAASLSAGLKGTF